MLCAAFAVRADVCQGLRPAPVKGGSLEKPMRPNTFRLPVKEGGPAFRIVIRSIDFEWPKTNVLIHTGEIEVSRCEDGKQVQVLPLTGWQPMNTGPTFHAQDINFDGYLDFAVVAEFGAKWASESWWIFNPATGQFVQNELTKDLRKLKAAGYQVDSTEHSIGTRYLTEPWGCGSTGDRYRVEASRLVLIHHEVPEPSSYQCSVTISDRVDGAMRVTKVKRFVRGKPVM